MNSPVPGERTRHVRECFGATSVVVDDSAALWTARAAATYPLAAIQTPRSACTRPRPPAAMDSFLRALSYLLLLASVPLVSALKFEVHAFPEHISASKERCIRNFVAKDQLVVVTAHVSGQRGDGQTLNMHVSFLSCWSRAHIWERDMGLTKSPLGNHRSKTP